MSQTPELLSALIAALTPIESEVEKVLSEVAGGLPPAEGERLHQEIRGALQEQRRRLEARIAPLLTLLREGLDLPSRQEFDALRSRVDKLEGQK